MLIRVQVVDRSIVSCIQSTVRCFPSERVLCSWRLVSSATGPLTVGPSHSRSMYGQCILLWHLRRMPLLLGPVVPCSSSFARRVVAIAPASYIGTHHDVRRRVFAPTVARQHRLTDMGICQYLFYSCSPLPHKTSRSSCVQCCFFMVSTPTPLPSGTDSRYPVNPNILFPRSASRARTHHAAARAGITQNVATSAGV